MAEWLRRQIRNLLEFLRAGSSPVGVVLVRHSIVSPINFYLRKFEVFSNEISNFLDQAQYIEFGFRGPASPTVHVCKEWIATTNTIVQPCLKKAQLQASDISYTSEYYYQFTVGLSLERETLIFVAKDRLFCFPALSLVALKDKDHLMVPGRVDDSFIARTSHHVMFHRDATTPLWWYRSELFLRCSLVFGSRCSTGPPGTPTPP